MASEAADEEWVTAAAEAEPDGAMWAFNAIRPATIRPPTTRKYFRTSITSPWAREDRRNHLVAAAAVLVHPGPVNARKPLWPGLGELAAGGMVSNHRLVLFTHALCRLSYPAVGGEANGPDLSGLSKIAHFQKMVLSPAGMPKRPIAYRIDAAGD